MPVNGKMGVCRDRWGASESCPARVEEGGLNRKRGAVLKNPQPGGWGAPAQIGKIPHWTGTAWF